MPSQKTKSLKAKEIRQSWHLLDLEGKILGRVSSQIAILLIGKNKPDYSPHLDCGDYVVAVNAEKLVFTGRKMTQKIYSRHSGYPGGFRQFTLKQMLEKDPRKILEIAVTGMLPKNKLRDRCLRRLKIFVGNEHPYAKLISLGEKGEEKHAKS